MLYSYIKQGVSLPSAEPWQHRKTWVAQAEVAKKLCDWSRRKTWRNRFPQAPDTDLRGLYNSGQAVHQIFEMSIG